MIWDHHIIDGEEASGIWITSSCPSFPRLNYEDPMPISCYDNGQTTKCTSFMASDPPPQITYLQKEGKTNYDPSYDLSAAGIPIPANLAPINTLEAVFMHLRFRGVHETQVNQICQVYHHFHLHINIITRGRQMI